MFDYPRRPNFSIPQNQNMSQWAKCFNTPILYTTHGKTNSCGVAIGYYRNFRTSEQI